MDANRFLRNRSNVTKLLILLEMYKQPGITLSEVARRLDVTTQAISIHVKALSKAGDVQATSAGLAVTPKGLQALHEGSRQLREAAEAIKAPLTDIQVTNAIAASAVRAGQEVNLFLDEGDLVAHATRKSPSRGVAQNDADPGDEVILRNLRGMVPLTPGTLTLVSLPSPAEGGVAKVNLPALKALLRGHEKPDRTGIHGTGARIVARHLGLKADFEFAPDRAAFNAAERGLDILLLVSRERMAETLHLFERLNGETIHRVPITILDAPEGR